MNSNYYIYILSSFKNKRLYIGLTSNLPKRVYEHKEKLIEGHTSKYNIDRLVYFEVFESAEEAVKRERQLKNWHRDWKINLVQERNPDWNDLYDEICA